MGSLKLGNVWVFSTADFWYSLAYESAEEKTQTLPNLRLPISSVDNLNTLNSVEGLRVSKWPEAGG